MISLQLLNRQRRAKKKAPVTLTADMLNELNKNHMGGFENYGQEELYNIDDAWENTKHDIKPKVSPAERSPSVCPLIRSISIGPQRFSNSMHGSGSNIYDSWRSNRYPPADYYYDQQKNYSHKHSAPYEQNVDPYLEAFHPHYSANHHHHHQSGAQRQPGGAMGLYTYNPRRYPRDYDGDF